MKKKLFLILAFLFITQIFGCKKENPIASEPIPTTPVVKIISPESIDVIGDSVNVQISATDDKGIVKVDIYIDNKIPTGGSLLVSPYVYVWAVDTLADSSGHTIFAKAYDADENVTSTPIRTVYSYKFRPTQLQVLFLSDTASLIMWHDNSRKETGFEIERKINNNPYSLVKTVTANITEVNIPGEYLADDSISFRVRAFTEKEKSSYSNTGGGKLIFAAPKYLSITKNTKDSVGLYWLDQSNIETGFDIYQGTDTVSMKIVKTVASNISTCIIVGNFNDTIIYYFRVQAKSKYNQSKFSNVVSKSKILKNGDMVLVNGGTYQMGSIENIDNGSPLHIVAVNSFYIKKTEVTQIEWKTVVNWKKTNGGTNLKADPSLSKGDSLPVDQVNWNEVQLWISYLNEMENSSKYRLPTEAEWEFAARGGNESKGFTYSGSYFVNDVAWNSDNSNYVTHSVGKKQANELGIYDMSGNVWEWCSDWYGGYNSVSQTNPLGPNTGVKKIIRGGCAAHDVSSRIAFRESQIPNISPSPTFYGFRYVLEM